MTLGSLLPYGIWMWWVLGVVNLSWAWDGGVDIGGADGGAGVMESSVESAQVVRKHAKAPQLIFHFTHIYRQLSTTTQPSTRDAWNEAARK